MTLHRISRMNAWPWLAMMTATLSVQAIAAQPATRPAASAPTFAEEELRPILSPAEKRQQALRVIDAFVNHVGEIPGIQPAARAAVAEGWSRHRNDEQPQEFLVAGLSILSEPFKTAMSALEEQRYDEADAVLEPLTRADDPYLSLHARAMLARSLVEQEKLEEAERILEPLAREESRLIEQSFLEPEVDFLLGYAQLSNLRYDAARESLQRFERQHPDAPDKFRLPARQMLQELQAHQPDSLGEISDLMVYAGRRLSSGEPGKPVQIKQDRAVELLSKLIEQAQQREQQERERQQQQQSQSESQGGSPRDRRQPNAPANRSVLPGGRGEIGRLDRSPVARPGEEWGSMRPEERERILQSLRHSFPSQYRQLVEQYYRQLAKEQ